MATEQQLRDRLASDPTDLESANELARLLFVEARYSEAADIFHHIVKRAPNDSFALFGMGAAYKCLCQYETAVVCLARSAKITPCPIALCNLGTAYFYLDREEEAIDALEHAIFLEKDYDDAMFMLANVLAKSGQVRRALNLYERALEIDPEFGDAWCEYALWKYMKIGSLDDAIDCLKKAAHFEPKRQRTWVFLDICYTLTANLTDSLRAFGRLADVVVDSPDDWISCARLYLEWNMVSQANKCADQLAQVSPDDPGLLSLRRKIYESQTQ